MVDGNQIVAVNPKEVPSAASEIDLGDVTLLPGLMDMELNMLIGGPGGPDGLPDPMHGVKDTPAYRTLRGAVNCTTTLMAGFTTVRNLGLMVYTAGFLLDVDLMKAVDQGWFPGPRIFPAGHAITPTGGHLDPTMFQGLAPGIMPQSVEQGIANGIAEVRKAVRYQIKYGAKLIKISASGGVMSFSSAAGCQQYSDEELAAIVDEAHRNGLRVAAHAHGDAGIRACVRAGVDCIEHGSLATDDTIKLMADTGHVPRRHHRARRPHGGGPHSPDPAEEGGRDLPPGPPDVRQGARRRREDRVRLGRAGDPARDAGRRAHRHGRPWDDTDAGAAGRDDDERGPGRARPRPRAAGTRVPGRHHRRTGRPLRGHHDDEGRPLRHEGRAHLQGRLSDRAAAPPEPDAATGMEAAMGHDDSLHPLVWQRIDEAEPDVDFTPDPPFLERT